MLKTTAGLSITEIDKRMLKNDATLTKTKAGLMQGIVAKYMSY